MTAPPSDTVLARAKELLAAAHDAEMPHVARAIRGATDANSPTITMALALRAIESLLTALDADKVRLAAERDEAQSTVQAWVHVAGSLEAHIMDRAAMDDPAKPETYLRILRADIAHVARSSEQICASRWHDAKVAREQHEALSARLAEAEKDENEAYEIGKREGYESAVQDIDLMTGGDGEYRFCTNQDPERHCPDAPAMKRRIAARFAEAGRVLNNIAGHDASANGLTGFAADLVNQLTASARAAASFLDTWKAGGGGDGG